MIDASIVLAVAGVVSAACVLASYYLNDQGSLP
jgi:hypothetical protein